MKVLFISDFLMLGHSGGAHLSRAHLNTLKSIYGVDNVIAIAITYSEDVKNPEYECHRSYTSKFGQFINVIQGNCHALNDNINKRIFQLIEDENVEMVFCDNGYFGKLCKLLKTRYPDVLLISFNHGILRNKTNQQINERKHNPMYWPQIYGLLRGELQTSRYADVNIVINSRDGEEFQKAYGRKAEIILPAYIEEMEKIDKEVRVSHTADILFVGGNFYPNVFGIKWFVENVLNEIKGDATLTIVGRGLEFLRNDPVIKKSARVEVIGGVEDLFEWYNKSNIVVGPIFHGDGMKTKTAEALQFGKLYIGTKEALCGYDDLKCYECNTKEEFIGMINGLIERGIQSYNPEIRKIYDENYSEASAVRILSNLSTTKVRGGGIVNKQRLSEYMKADRLANQKKSKYPKPFADYEWRFLIALRRLEYALNTPSMCPLWKIYILYRKAVWSYNSVRTGITIYPNCFGKGLTLWHYGYVVVNDTVKGGDYCTLQCGVNISEQVVLGNHVYLAPGVKVLKNTTISDNVVIGANAVVTKDILESNTTWAGIPARKLSDTGYYRKI